MHKLPPLISDQPALDALCENLARAKRVAVDTEFVRDRTYFPRLCLIQIATDEALHLIDPLGGIDLAPLFSALAEPGLEKILHAARQDLEIFYLETGDVPRGVFDTQLAAACLGYGEQLSYSKLVGELLGVDLGKSHARTDWIRRPLAPAQLRYAADDVLYLLRVHDELTKRLSQAGRQDWLAGEFAALSETGLYAPEPKLAYRRIRAQKNLDATRRARLAALAQWREQMAIDKNLPRRWIVADKPLLDLASLDGSDPDAVRGVAGLPAKLLSRELDAICALLSTGSEQANNFRQGSQRPTAAENRTLKKLSEFVRSEATRLKTSPALLATRDDLRQLMAGDPEDCILMQGWRRGVVGEKLSRLLQSEKPAPETNA